jgi:class 3 adenylate cyclase
VICPVCQTANEEDANFCLNCNHRLVVVCPRCSRRVNSRANYCDRCGLALNTPYRVENVQPESRPATTLKRVDQVASQPSKPAGQPVGAPLPAEAKRSATQAPAVESALAQYIPAELMRKLEMARTSGEMVGERRVVTMMFCDVKGSTAAAEQLDPEEWSEIINGAFEHMIRPVYTYEGTVARLMGDSILAFFGAPLAHEDDPQRAVLAGLDILANMTPYREKLKQSWGIDVNVRVGINTGLVVVGAVGSDLRMEYTALGDAINLAARMEQTAEPGTVQIAEETYKLVRHLFEFETLPPIEVKGKAESVQAYRVLARRAVAGRVRGIEGLHAEMVGREAELATFKRIIVDLKQGVGRIVSVLGEAGLGKSRLVGEAKDYLKTFPALTAIGTKRSVCLTKPIMLTACSGA